MDVPDEQPNDDHGEGGPPNLYLAVEYVSHVNVGGEITQNDFNKYLNKYLNKG